MHTCQWEQSFLRPTSLANSPILGPASWGCWGMHEGWKTICRGTVALHRSKAKSILSRLALSGPAMPVHIFLSELLLQVP